MTTPLTDRYLEARQHLNLTPEQVALIDQRIAGYSLTLDDIDMFNSAEKVEGAFEFERLIETFAILARLPHRDAIQMALGLIGERALHRRPTGPADRPAVTEFETRIEGLVRHLGGDDWQLTARDGAVLQEGTTDALMSIGVTFPHGTDTDIEQEAA